MAEDNLAMDMDIDIDLDTGVPDPEEQHAIDNGDAMNFESANKSHEAPKHDLDPDTIHTKIHICGLDNLSTSDIQKFAIEHFPAADPTKVEWVDDHSANLIYASTDLTTEALDAFALASDSSITYDALVPAKPLSTHPDTTLTVRRATITDVKAPRAREASRFYLLNPAHDPSSRQRPDRRARTERAGSKRRRDDDAPAPFDVSMYDDDAASLAARRPRRASNDDRTTKRVRFGGDLFADKPRARRSASPERSVAVDGRFGFDEPEEVSTPRRPDAGEKRELFPDKVRAVRELFPSPVHRRTDAFDAADATDGDTRVAPVRGLAERITDGTRTKLEIKGRGSKAQGGEMRSVEENPGFSIRGVAKAMNPRVRELFPEREAVDEGNSGKELFAGKGRRRAEELFS